MNAPETIFDRWAKSKCVFERYLDELPFPAVLPPSLRPGRTIHAKRFGDWLKRNNAPEFNRRYEVWRSVQ